FPARHGRRWRSSSGPTHARHRELDGQDIALFARGKVARSLVHGGDGAVGKSFGIKASRCLGVLVVPEADSVLRHRKSPCRLKRERKWNRSRLSGEACSAHRSVPTTANQAPCGSCATAIYLGPGTSTGP